MKQSRFIRAIITISAIVITYFVVTNYLNKHPLLLHQLSSISILALISIFILYVAMFVILLQLFSVTILLCQRTVSFAENLYINGYSIGLNFILPGQAGPLFRSGYVKRKFGISFKNFLSVTLLYYFFYSLISFTFVAIGSRSWWQSILCIVILSWLLLYLMRWYTKKKSLDTEKIAQQKKWTAMLFLLTFVQFSLQTFIYFIELKAVDYWVSIHQVIAYTGVANLSLFVGLTPAGIGIRESFLVLSEKIHQIPTSAIVLANLIDRSIYIIFIITIVIASLVLHQIVKNKEKA